VTIVTSLLLHWQGPGTVLTIRSPADIDVGKLRHLGVDRQALWNGRSGGTASTMPPSQPLLLCLFCVWWS